LRIALYIITGYLSVTGVIGGATDQITLKATKLTISGMVPVIGNIMADASETILVSAAVVKNAVGVYGLWSAVAIGIGPFLNIGVQYLSLKATQSICTLCGSKQIPNLIGDFASAMGLLLAMTGTMCLLILISTVCFMKGIG
jgi:stage III sporulation protein AE